jgi:simple sugar transport system ATP-binding protein
LLGFYSASFTKIPLIGSGRMLEMKNITKEFPGVKALDSVNFNVGDSEIHALVGANGAGKSTLMKVLAGVYNTFDGEILIDGRKVDILNPKQAKKEGIVIVYQEVDTALIPSLSVAENIMMDYMINDQQNTFMDWKYIKKRAKEEVEALDLDINVNKNVGELSLSEKQMVLIGRAVFLKAKYLILDEPTAPLSLEESRKLFEIVNKLREQGMSIIFISHRLDEVFKICEKVSVLRNGEFIGSYDIKEMTIDKVVEKMLGRKLENTFPKIDCEINGTIFEASDLSGKNGIESVNFKVRAGEIVGLAGLVGAGKTELSKLLFGESKVTAGKIKLHDQEIHNHNTYQAVTNGLALVPEERHTEGVLVNESIETNLTLVNLDHYCRNSFMSRRKIKEASQKVIDNVGIKTPSEKQLVNNLSGGNQQKVSIGKWLLADYEVYIFDEPTKGIDVGSKAEIYKLIGEIVSNGKGVIYASSEFEEILGLTDRVYVMYNGKIVKELKTSETDEEELLFYSTGGGSSEH